MRFLYPLGFIGLVAVPVLIIIYIIKNKYTEQVVPATYIWTLSEKFLKRKNPISKLAGLISLILQILAVIFISLAIANPVFTLPNAAGDYCFVLDGSGSMNIVYNGVTRFDSGKKRINDMIKSSVDGSTYTLICVGNLTNVVYKDLDNKEQALKLLDGLTPACAASDVASAAAVAQEYFNENPDIKTYLVTDRQYVTGENVQLIDVSAGESNYAVSDVSYTLSGGRINVSGKAVSYAEDATVTVELYIDGEYADEQTVNLTKLELKEFTFKTDAQDFASLRVAVKESDALPTDNEALIYNEKSDASFRTLIVGNGSPFYIMAAFISLGNNNIDLLTPEEYEGGKKEGYGLYIFNGYAPDAMPRDGAVWFFNPNKSTENSGFSVQGDLVEKTGRIEYSNSSSSKVKNLLAGTVRDDIYISGYMKCGLYRSFTTIISFEGNPLVFVGSNSFGNREVVFAFDLQRSDIAMSFDFTPLVRNLLNYTFPQVIENKSVYCEETVQINVPANCNSIRLDTPEGKIEYLDAGVDYIEYQPSEAGVYTVTLMLGNIPRTVYFYSGMPEAERFTAVENGGTFSLNGEAGGGMRDGVYDDLIIMFIVLAVLILADWVVYCYEQYQL